MCEANMNFSLETIFIMLSKHLKSENTHWSYIQFDFSIYFLLNSMFNISFCLLYK